jgi:CheY-like chemotaxis protein/HPt (histidine-containing phosphotransfer) domain-containing protein
LGLVISDMIAEKMGSKIEIDSVIGEGSTFHFTLTVETEHGEAELPGSLSRIGRCLIVDDNTNNRMILERLLAGWGVESACCDNGLEAVKLLGTTNTFDVLICDYNMPGIDGLETIRRIRQKMIAEDVAMNMLMIKALIGRILPESVLLEAVNGLETLKQYQQNQPDLIFMDVQMPGMDGLEVTRNIRRLEQASGTHVPVIALTAGAFREEQEKCLTAGMDDFLTKPINPEKIEKVLADYLTKPRDDRDSVHFSWNSLLEELDDVKLAKQLISMAQESFPKDLEQLNVLVGKGDFEGIRNLAHRIRGSALVIGCAELAAIAMEMEEMANSVKNLSLLKCKLDAMKAEWSLVSKLLKEPMISE